MLSGVIRPCESGGLVRPESGVVQAVFKNSAGRGTTSSRRRMQSPHISPGLLALSGAMFRMVEHKPESERPASGVRGPLAAVPLRVRQLALIPNHTQHKRCAALRHKHTAQEFT